MKCYLCPRQCGADRKENYGVCLSSEALRVARVGLHFYEEPPISGSHGSGTVFFSGCSLACPFCQNYEVSHKQIGVDITPERLSELFAELEAQGAHNINLVNPTHYASQIFKALELYRPKIPIVWNTHGYETQETLSAAERYVDIYLTDYKYADPFLAKRYSKAADYPDVAFAALCTMRRQKKDVYEGDLLKQGVIVRHLMLPGAVYDTVAVLQKLSAAVPDTLISLMSQYTPCGEIDAFPELKRRITAREYKRAKEVFLSLDLKGFLQDSSSAESEYIPVWDFTG